MCYTEDIRCYGYYGYYGSLQYLCSTACSLLQTPVDGPGFADACAFKLSKVLLVVGRQGMNL